MSLGALHRATFAAALAFGLLTCWLDTRLRDFPFFYHSDESAKVEQLMSREWNFHHPMLLLAATDALLSPAERSDPQRVVEAGRVISAICTSVAVGALTWLAFLHAGALAGIAAGLLLLFHQQLFELAHYMKEDPALLAGVALTFLACWFYERKPSVLAALAAGATIGVAMSGKYVGAVMWLCYAPLILVAAKQRWPHALWALAASAVVFAMFNWPLLHNLGAFRASFGREIEYVVEGSKGMTRSIPHTVYLNVFADNTTPVIWALLLVYYHGLWREWRERRLTELIIALFPIVLLVVFSFSPKTNDRYFLPLTASFYLLAAFGLAEVQRWRARFPTRRRLGTATLQHPHAIGSFVLAIALACEAPKFIDVFKAFQHDDRHELANYIKSELPASARIAQDARVMLPDKRNRERGRIVLELPQQVLTTRRYAFELGTLEELRAAGVTHVAVSESDYGRFFVRGMVPKDEYRDEYLQNRAWYERLFAEGKRLFEKPRGTVIYLHPGLQLYELPPAR